MPSYPLIDGKVVLRLWQSDINQSQLHCHDEKDNKTKNFNNHDIVSFKSFSSWMQYSCQLKTTKIVEKSQ
jgi:hypothetical protein